MTPSYRGPGRWMVALLLAFSIGIVYFPALNTPFIYDDFLGIVRNKSIESLWPLVGTKARPGPLNTPPDNAVSARPLVNLSLAINRYFGGADPRGYHAVSVVLHFFTAMLIWAVTRRTLRLPYFAGRFETSSGWLALGIALLWALHPLQSESVTYSIQRTELMMAFFYMATLYCGLRFFETRRAIWPCLATFGCFCGMASKEVMVSAPLIVLLFERTFVAGSLWQALRRSWPLYIGLFATWILLIGLTLNSPRANSASFGIGPPLWIWWATQCKVLLMYFKLAIWPWPLQIHYELPYVNTLAGAALVVAPVVAIGAATLVLLWRNRPAGFLLTWVFAVLAPTSIIPILTEMAAERRMYLPLAALLTLAVIGAYMITDSLLAYQKRNNRVGFRTRTATSAILIPVMLIAVVFGLVTAKRVSAYNDPMGLWQQVLERQPQNHLAHQTVGFYLSASGNVEGAVEHYREAVRLNPGSTPARYGLAMLLLKIGAADEAAAELQRVVAAMPTDAGMHHNLAVALFQSGRNDDAITAYRKALGIDPANAAILSNLGMALQKAGKYADAVESFERAAQASPATMDIYKHLADFYSLSNQQEKSIAALKKGLALARAAGDEQNAQQFSARLRMTESDP